MIRGPERPPLRLVRLNEAIRAKSADDLVEEAKDWLRRAGIPYSFASPIHIKIETLNFYPTTGTLNFDNHRRLPERGLAGLKEVLERFTGRVLPPVN